MKERKKEKAKNGIEETVTVLAYKKMMWHEKSEEKRRRQADRTPLKPSRSISQWEKEMP